MKIGVAFPMDIFGSDHGAIREFALTAEALGFDHINALDHVLGPVHEGRTPPLDGPYTEHDIFHEPLMLFAFWGGITSRIGFASGIVILPQRQTALVAKQVAELDILTGGGRFRLGLGSGWNYVEYDSLDVPYRDRGRRMDEQITVLRRLWTEDVVDFTGHYHRLDRVSLLPHPPQPHSDLVRGLERRGHAARGPHR